MTGKEKLGKDQTDKVHIEKHRSENVGSSGKRSGAVQDSGTPGQQENLLARMNRQYRSLSKGQKRLADYISEHYDQAVSMTAARLGAQANGSDPRPCDLQCSSDMKAFRNFTGRWKNW